MTALIEDRECACGHFYGNHEDRAEPSTGLAAGLGGTLLVTSPCSREDCGCEDYTPAEPLEGEHPQALLDDLQLLGGRWGQVVVAEAAASLMVPGWTPGGTR